MGRFEHWHRLLQLVDNECYLCYFCFLADRLAAVVVGLVVTAVVVVVTVVMVTIASLPGSRTSRCIADKILARSTCTVVLSGKTCPGCYRDRYGVPAPGSPIDPT